MKPRYSYLLDEIDIRQPKTIMDIGTYSGARGRKMLMVALSYNSDLYYYGFDLWEKMTKKVNAKEYNGKSPCCKADAKKKLNGFKIKLIQGDTNKTLPLFVPHRQIDFVFIDGGHSLDTIENDWNHVKELMDDETVVVFDDYYHKRKDVGAKDLIDTKIDKSKFRCTFIGNINSVKKLSNQLVKVVKI